VRQCALFKDEFLRVHVENDHLRGFNPSVLLSEAAIPAQPGLSNQ